ncbi:MAG: class I SAM-dependent methyltransferase [Verrucomicrobiota bacterium]
MKLPNPEEVKALESQEISTGIGSVSKILIVGTDLPENFSENLTAAVRDTNFSPVYVTADQIMDDRVQCIHQVPDLVVIAGKPAEELDPKFVGRLRNQYQNSPVIAFAARGARTSNKGELQKNIGLDAMNKAPSSASELRKLLDKWTELPGEMSARGSRRKSRKPEPQRGLEAAPSVEAAEFVHPFFQTFGAELRDLSRPIDNAFQVICHDLTGQPLSGEIVRVKAQSLTVIFREPQAVLAEGEKMGAFEIAHKTQRMLCPECVIRQVIKTDDSQIAEISFNGISGEWQKKAQGILSEASETLYAQLDRMEKIPAEFRKVVSSIRFCLEEFKHLLAGEQLFSPEVAADQRCTWEGARLTQIAPEMLAFLSQQFARFEAVAANLPEGIDDACHLLVKREIHPLILCAPFLNRVYEKPLGFAGDYGMLDKMLETPWQGLSMYGKLVNGWFVTTPASEAYRERIQLLQERLISEARRAVRKNGVVKILSLGCGAATEVKRFLEKSDLSDNAEIHLLDFNKSTLAEAQARLDKTRSDHSRTTKIFYRNESVQSVIKHAVRAAKKGTVALQGMPVGGFDFIYCMGLFDYFPDKVNSSLIDFFYRALAEDGSIMACNFLPENPNRMTMKYVLDWHLIYRSATDMLKLVPDSVQENCACQCFQLTSGAEAYLVLEK